MQQLPLVTIITVVFNNKDYILDAIFSVKNQHYQRIEYIVIDGGSTDGTVEIIKNNSKHIDIFISEPDKGIFDALNKGIAKSSGEIIGILHSDDIFSDSLVISDSVDSLLNCKSDLCFSNLIIVQRDNLDKVIRYYNSSIFKKYLLRIGLMPAHPTIFIRKKLFDKVGCYSVDYKIASDFDFLVKAFYKHSIKFSIINRVTVIMRNGGTSNLGLSSKKIINHEIFRSLKANGLFIIYPMLYLRYFIRVIELFFKPKQSDLNL